MHSEKHESEIVTLNKFLVEKDEVISWQIIHADKVYSELSELNNLLIEKDELINHHYNNISNLNNEIVNLKGILKQHDEQIAQFEESLSWRITKPFRYLNRILKKLSLSKKNT